MEEKHFIRNTGEWFLWPRQASNLYLERQPECYAKTFFVRETYWLCFGWFFKKELNEHLERAYE